MRASIDFGVRLRRKREQEAVISRVVGVAAPGHEPRDTDCPACGSDSPEHDAEFCPRTDCPYAPPTPALVRP